MPEKIHLYIVLDANVLIRDFWMTGKDFDYLRTHQFLDHRPVIPEVAYKEARKHLRNRVEVLISNKKLNGDRATANYNKLVRLFNYKKLEKSPRWSIPHLLKRWEKHVNLVLKEFGGHLLPEPRIEVSELVERSIERKRPFSKGDKGFRDTLIWISTLDLVKSSTRVSFVTRNVNDFL